MVGSVQVECEFFHQVGNYVVLRDFAEAEGKYGIQHRSVEGLGGCWRGPEAMPIGEDAIAEPPSGFYTEAEI